MKPLVKIIFSFILLTQTHLCSASYLDSCKIHIELKNYTSASIALSSYLRNEVVHKNISTFYLGVITYHLEFNHRSEKAFLKFLELDSEESVLYDSALFYLSTISKRTDNSDIDSDICVALGPLHEHEICNKCEGQGLLEKDCQYCSGEGDDVCTNCNGGGVVIQNSNFGSVYRNCPVCAGTGYDTCKECRGTGTMKAICHTCEGSGERHKERDCSTIAKQLNEIRQNRQTTSH